MTHTHIAFLTYIALILLFLLVLAGYRTYLGLTKQVKSLRFASDGSGVPELGFRLTRVHANAVECFPFIGGLMLFAIASGNTDVTDGLAMIVIYARIAQSVILAISTSNFAVQLRFATFLVQFGICIYWTYMFLHG